MVFGAKLAVEVLLCRTKYPISQNPNFVFYTPREQFRPAEEEIDEQGDCVRALLMVQAGHDSHVQAVFKSPTNYF